jgi:hypothetical protein
MLGLRCRVQGYSPDKKRNNEAPRSAPQGDRRKGGKVSVSEIRIIIGLLGSRLCFPTSRQNLVLTPCRGFRVSQCLDTVKRSGPFIRAGNGCILPFHNSKTNRGGGSGECGPTRNGFCRALRRFVPLSTILFPPGRIVEQNRWAWFCGKHTPRSDWLKSRCLRAKMMQEVALAETEWTPRAGRNEG